MYINDLHIFSFPRNSYRDDDGLGIIEITFT